MKRLSNFIFKYRVYKIVCLLIIGVPSKKLILGVLRYWTFDRHNIVRNTYKFKDVIYGVGIKDKPTVGTACMKTAILPFFTMSV